MNNPLSSADPLGLYWEYCIDTGAITYVNEQTEQRTYIGTGYSGNGMGTNNFYEENIQNVGPIPAGEYKIGPAFNSVGDMGPITMHLIPINGTIMFNRHGIYMHGPNKKHPEKTISKGCIIASPDIRRKVSNSTDRDLWVIECK